MSTGTKTCRRCGTEKPASAFKHKAATCKACVVEKPVEQNKHYREAKGLAELIERVRWKNAVRVKGYRFTGTIPTPKGPEYYALENKGGRKL